MVSRGQATVPHPHAQHGLPLTLRSTSMSRPLWASMVLGSACSLGPSPAEPWRSCKERPWEVMQGSGGAWGWHRGLNQQTLTPQPCTPSSHSSITLHSALVTSSQSCSR